MTISRSVLSRRNRALVGAVAVIATGVGTAVAVPAHAGGADPGSQSAATHAPKEVPQNMSRMHELMMSGNPGMARMHELMMSGNPGMARMHEQMMGRGTGHHGGQK